MSKDELESLLNVLDGWLIVFGLCVAIGVTGESIVGFMHFRKGNQLRRLQNEENLAQQREIERMKNEAGLTLERAANAESQSAQAGEGTAKALAQAAAANERATKLELEAGQQRERAAKAERDLLELQQRIAPRHITAAQETALSNDLKPLTGKHVAVFIISGQPENEAFGHALAASLKKAGLEVEIQPGMKFGGPVEPGISLIIGKNRLPDANTLADALINADVADKPVSADHSAVDDLLQIVVAPK
jgi:hypothetical protein